MCRKIAKVTTNYVNDTKTVNQPDRQNPCFMLEPICPITVRDLDLYKDWPNYLNADCSRYFGTSKEDMI